jgi:predicted DNA-binding transcriptional regulator AlpA
MTDTKQLRDSKWLALLLGISVSAIEKRRSTDPSSLPAPIRIGRMVRYDEATVFAWLEKLSSNSVS